MAEHWVDVVLVHGDEYDEISNFGIQEMADYLAQWDYGVETDAAHLINGRPWGWGLSDRQYQVTVGGLDYILDVNHPLGYVSLNRRPIEGTAE